VRFRSLAAPAPKKASRRANVPNANAGAERLNEIMNEHLKEYPLIIDIPVAWGDMDAFQHVNNAVYFRYFESARIAYFAKLGFDETMKRDGVGPILAATQCRFRMPLTYPDTVSVGTGISQLGEDRFVMRYAVWSHERQKIAAEGDGTVVSYDYRMNRKTPIPAEVRSRIIELEKLDAGATNIL
jgi:acyl-CoA thioester hydrolase